MPADDGFVAVAETGLICEKCLPYVQSHCDCQTRMIFLGDIAKPDLVLGDIAKPDLVLGDIAKCLFKHHISHITCMVLFYTKLGHGFV